MNKKFKNSSEATIWINKMAKKDKKSNILDDKEHDVIEKYYKNYKTKK